MDKEQQKDPAPDEAEGGSERHRPITVAGHEYASVEDLPPDVRAAWERTMEAVRSVPREVPYDPVYLRRKSWDRFYWRAPVWVNVVIVVICVAIFVWIFRAY